MNRWKVIGIVLICIVLITFTYFKWTKYQFEVQLKLYLTELYPEDSFEIDEVVYDYKFRKFVGYVKPVHSNFIFQVRSTGDRMISDYGYRYWEYLIESELDLYLKNEFTYQAYSNYGITMSSDIDILNLQGERIAYRDVKDKLTSAYLVIQLGSYPLDEDDLTELLHFIRDKGFVFSHLRIEGKAIESQDHQLVVEYDDLYSLPRRAFD